MDHRMPPELGWLFIALFGGIAKFFDAFLKGEEGINIWRFIALLIVSGFCGYMSASVSNLHDPEWSTIAAGIGGFAGTKIIEIFMDIVRSRFGGKPKE